jgi:outer membrane receptor protein involved in Fe transport
LIEPEFVNSSEVGFELGFLGNRINLDATYFNQKNTNQILEVQQSAATGIHHIILTLPISILWTGVDLNLTHIRVGAEE